MHSGKSRLKPTESMLRLCDLALRITDNHDATVLRGLSEGERLFVALASNQPRLLNSCWTIAQALYRLEPSHFESLMTHFGDPNTRYQWRDENP